MSEPTIKKEEILKLLQLAIKDRDTLNGEIAQKIQARDMRIGQIDLLSDQLRMLDQKAVNMEAEAIKKKEEKPK